MPTPQAAILLRHIRKLAAPVAETESDCELLRRFRLRRDEEAFAMLLRRHGPMVLRVCRGVAANDADAEDAFQATFLTLARNSASIRSRHSAAGWLHGVACNTARKVRDAAARRARHDRAAPIPSNADPLAAMSARELLTALDEELSRLPEKYRAPLLLCYLEGLDREEAAQRLACPLGTLKGRLERGKERLRTALERRGLSLGAALAAVLVGRETAEAAVPRVLIQTTLRTAMLTTPAVASVLVVKLAAACFLLIAATVGVVVVGWVESSRPTGASLANAAGSAHAVGLEDSTHPTQDTQTERVDAFGDPLPTGAIARLGTLRLKHGGIINSVVFMPYGKELVSHGALDGIRIWDVATGRELRHLAPEADVMIGCAMATRDGTQLLTKEFAVKMNRHFVRYRDRADLTVTREFQIDYFDNLFLSPDGKVLFALGYNNQIPQLLDAKTGQKIHSLKSHGWPYCHVFSADGKTLVTGGKDGAIRFWDVASGEKKQEITDHPNIVGMMALSGDGKLLATVGMTEKKQGAGSSFPWDHFIRVWDVANGKEVRQLAMPKKEAPWGGDYGIASLIFAPDGKTLVSAGQEVSIRFWDPVAGKELRRLDMDFYGAAKLTFSPDGKTLAVVTGGSSIYLIDLATGKSSLSNMGHFGGIYSLAVTPNGRTTATTGGENVIRLWDTATGRERQRLQGHESYVTGLQLAADGRTFFTNSADKTLRAWDLTTGKELHRIKRQEFSTAWQLTAVSPDAKILALPADTARKDCLLLDVATGKELRRLSGHEPWLSGMAFTPDGRILVTWDLEHTVRLWDVASGEKRLQYELLKENAPKPVRGGVLMAADGKMYRAFSAALSADGRFIITGGSHSIILQDLATGKEARRFEELPDNPGVIAFTRDGRMLAWAGDDAIIHLLEIATGRERGTFAGHKGRINAGAFSADGRILVSGSQDTTAVVWDLVTGGAKVVPLSAAEQDTCWTDLRSDDGARAFSAIGRLVASPVEAVSALRKRLQPATTPEAKHLATLIGELDSDTFAARDAAMKELMNLGEQAAPALREALDKSPSPESRRRIDSLLAKLKDPGAIGEPLRQTRAIEALERIGTPEARQLLTTLAAGAPGARLTREAKAALERLQSLTR